MWAQGLGKSGMILDSTYDLDCASCELCKCVQPTVMDSLYGDISYTQILQAHLRSAQSLKRQYGKPYKLFISGLGLKCMKVILWRIIVVRVEGVNYYLAPLLLSSYKPKKCTINIKTKINQDQFFMK